MKIQYVHQNYLEFDADEQYDLIMLIFCDFCVLNPEQRKTLLGKFKKLLKPEGAILLDVSSVHAFHEKAESATYSIDIPNNFWSPEKCYVFLNTFKYADVKVALDKYTIIEKDRTRNIFNWFQHYDTASLAKELAENGLDIVGYLANVAGDEFDADGNEFAVIAKSNGE